MEFRVLPSLPKSVRLACRATVVGAVTVEPLIKLKAAPVTNTASGPTSLYDFEDDDFEPDVADYGAPSPVGEALPMLIGAVDLGTTNVSAVLIESESGREVGRATTDNLQRAWGADVLTRLSAALAGDDVALRDAAQRSVMDSLGEAGGEPFSAIVPRVRGLVISTNSVMSPLLTGQDASGLASAPFDPPRDLKFRGGPLGALAPRLGIRVLNPLAGFVGGDIRSGVIATRLTAGAPRPTLLVDMGTNAEVVLATTTGGAGQLWVASAPAGSALEGVMVGGARILGSEFVRLLSAARAAGAIDATGLMGESFEGVSRDAAGVLQLATHLIPGVDREVSVRMPFLSQLVVREFQLAKAAVRAAVSGVLSAAGVEVEQLDRVLVAGAFGGAIAPADMLSLGIVPPVSAWRIVPAGNTSLTGAVLVAMGEGDQVSAEVSLVDLVASPTFAADLIRYTALGG